MVAHCNRAESSQSCQESKPLTPAAGLLLPGSSDPDRFCTHSWLSRIGFCAARTFLSGGPPLGSCCWLDAGASMQPAFCAAPDPVACPRGLLTRLAPLAPTAAAWRRGSLGIPASSMTAALEPAAFTAVGADGVSPLLPPPGRPAPFDCCSGQAVTLASAASGLLRWIARRLVSFGCARCAGCDGSHEPLAGKA